MVCIEHKHIKPITLGVVASSGGGTIISAYKIFNSVYPDQLELIVATDRCCDIESFCLENEISCHRFEQSNNVQLSKDIQKYFTDMGGVDALILFFLRIITKDLFMAYPSLNIHPSLLPDFPGFSPLRRALNAGVNEIGATMHMADDNIDAGDILMQKSHSIETNLTEEEAGNLSFCQKVYIALTFITLLYLKKITFVKDKKGKFIPKYDKEILGKDGVNLLELDEALNYSYQKKMEEEGYSKWLV